VTRVRLPQQWAMERDLSGKPDGQPASGPGCLQWPLVHWWGRRRPYRGAGLERARPDPGVQHGGLGYTKPGSRLTEAFQGQGHLPVRRAGGCSAAKALGGPGWGDRFDVLPVLFAWLQPQVCFTYLVA